jgi:hypothetical protein
MSSSFVYPKRRARPHLVLLAVACLAAAATTPARATPPDSLAPPPAVRRWQTGALPADRLQHASLAFGAGLGLGLVTREPLAAGLGAMVAGFLKEALDPRVDAGDLAADALGAGLAAWATAALRR